MKALLKIAKIVCYVCSFPLFMVFAILASMHNVEKGGSYGLLTYAKHYRCRFILGNMGDCRLSART